MADPNLSDAIERLVAQLHVCPPLSREVQTVLDAALALETAWTEVMAVTKGSSGRMTRAEIRARRDFLIAEGILLAVVSVYRETKP